MGVCYSSYCKILKIHIKSQCDAWRCFDEAIHILSLGLLTILCQWPHSSTPLFSQKGSIMFEFPCHSNFIINWQFLNMSAQPILVVWTRFRIAYISLPSAHYKPFLHFPIWVHICPLGLQGVSLPPHLVSSLFTHWCKGGIVCFTTRLQDFANISTLDERRMNQVKWWTFHGTNSV